MAQSLLILGCFFLNVSSLDLSLEIPPIVLDISLSIIAYFQPIHKSAERLANRNGKRKFL